VAQPWPKFFDASVLRVVLDERVNQLARNEHATADAHAPEFAESHQPAGRPGPVWPVRKFRLHTIEGNEFRHRASGAASGPASTRWLVGRGSQ
jgi:hypothetical protein